MTAIPDAFMMTAKFGDFTITFIRDSKGVNSVEARQCGIRFTGHRAVVIARNVVPVDMIPPFMYDVMQPQKVVDPNQEMLF